MQPPQQPNSNNPHYPYQQYPSGYQPVPPQQPQKKKRPTLKERWNSGIMGKISIIALIILALLVCGTCSGLLHVVTSTTGAKVASTRHENPTKPIKAAVAAPVKPKPTARPKPTAKVKDIAFVPTHGTPLLGGSISDFIGNYGKGGSVQAGTAPNGLEDVRINWYIGQDLLSVDYYASNDSVYSITYSPSANLSNDQIKTYLVQFFPSDANVNSAAPNTDTLIAYTSSQYPHMFLHLDGRTGYVNIV